MNRRATAAVRGRKDIEIALVALTPAQKARLKLVANKYAAYRGIEPEDLIQEAFCRALEEDGRRCPLDVDIVKFLAEAMRSIAHGESEKAVNQIRVVPIAAPGVVEKNVADPADPTPTAEDILMAKQAEAAIRRDLLSLFNDDPHARDIVDGTLAGFNGAELRQLTGLDDTAYDSKRRLIRRRVDKKHPQG